MRLLIDMDRCQGHGRCALAFPQVVVDTDDMGQPVIDGDGSFPVDLLPDAEAAVENCPEGAISIGAAE